MVRLSLTAGAAEVLMVGTRDARDMVVGSGQAENSGAGVVQLVGVRPVSDVAEEPCMPSSYTRSSGSAELLVINKKRTRVNSRDEQTDAHALTLSW